MTLESTREVVLVMTCSHAIADQYTLAAWLSELLQAYARLRVSPTTPPPARLPLVLPQLPAVPTARWSSPINVVRSSACAWMLAPHPTCNV